jgi:hypothetical protein
LPRLLLKLNIRITRTYDRIGSSLPSNFRIVSYCHSHISTANGYLLFKVVWHLTNKPEINKTIPKRVLEIRSLVVQDAFKDLEKCIGGRQKFQFLGQSHWKKSNNFI